MAKQRKSSASPIAGIIGLLFMFIMLWIVWKAVAGVWAILSFLAIPLFILALIFNYRVVPDYFNWVMDKVRNDTPKGLMIAAGSIIGYPFVSAWLAIKAYTTRNKIKKQKGNPKKEDYLKYEEVEDDEDFLELDDLDKVKQPQPQARADNDYEDLFE